MRRRIAQLAVATMQWHEISGITPSAKSLHRSGSWKEVYFSTPKVNTVSDCNVWPGFSSVEGNDG